MAQRCKWHKAEYGQGKAIGNIREHVCQGT